MNQYLEIAHSGRNDWWRFLLALFIIIFAWQLVGSIPTFLLILYVMLDSNPATQVTPEGAFLGVDINLSFAVMMLASWAFLAGIILAMRIIHKRKWLTLITPERSVNWTRLGQGFLTWFILAAVAGIIEALLYPGRYVLTLDLPRFIPFVFLASIFIPIQTTTEELLFRGYILQAFGLRLRNRYLLSLLSGSIFMLPHLLNPEAKLNYLIMGIYYFALGTTMAFITLMDGRLELALGMHAANNLFTALFANATVTVMPTPAIFTVMELDVVYSTVATLVAILAFLVLFLGPLRRTSLPASLDTGEG